jgi:hypothetical protein
VAEMTRQEMAANGALNQLDYVASELHNKSLEHADAGRDIDCGHSAWESQCVAAAAAELRKTCAGCSYWKRPLNDLGGPQPCRLLMFIEMRGSDFCSRWSAK